jgi:hypothetical protein
VTPLPIHIHLMASTHERYLKRDAFCTTEAKARLFASLPKIQGEAEQYCDKALRPCASPPNIPRVKDTQSISEQPTQRRPDETGPDHYASEEASATGIPAKRVRLGRSNACAAVLSAWLPEAWPIALLGRTKPPRRRSTRDLAAMIDDQRHAASAAGHFASCACQSA